MKTLQQLPGVAVGTEGMTGLYVRGAGPMRFVSAGWKSGLSCEPFVGVFLGVQPGRDKEYPVL